MIKQTAPVSPGTLSVLRPLTEKELLHVAGGGDSAGGGAFA